MTIRTSAKSVSRSKKLKYSIEIPFRIIELPIGFTYKFYNLCLETNQVDVSYAWYIYEYNLFKGFVSSLNIYQHATNKTNKRLLETYTGKYAWKVYSEEYIFYSKIETEFLNSYKEEMLAHTRADEFKQ